MVELYHSWFSTCSQKVRLVLAEKGVDWVSRPIDLPAREHLTADYLALNPNGVVPTLIHDGTPVVDSSVICEYLDEVFPENPLTPADPLGRAAMRSWMRYLEEVPTSAIRVPSFNKLFLGAVRPDDRARFEAMADSSPLRRHFFREMGPAGFSADKEQAAIERLASALDRVETALADGRAYLLGVLTIADLLLLPTVVRMDDLGLASMWRDHSSVADWYARMTARPSFAIAYPPQARVAMRAA